MAAINRTLTRLLLLAATVIGPLLFSRAASADPWQMGELKSSWERCLQQGGAKSSEECKKLAARKAWQEAETRKAAQRIPEVAACFKEVASKAAQRGQGPGRLDEERRSACNACWSMYYGRLAFMLHMGRRATANGPTLSDLTPTPIVPPEAIVCSPSAVWEGHDPLMEAELAGVDVERRLHGLQREAINVRFASEREKSRTQQIAAHAALNPDLRLVTAYENVVIEPEANKAIAQTPPKPKRSTADLTVELEAMAKRAPAKPAKTGKQPPAKPPTAKKSQTADDVYADLDDKPPAKKPAAKPQSDDIYADAEAKKPARAKPQIAAKPKPTQGDPPKSPPVAVAQQQPAKPPTVAKPTKPADSAAAEMDLIRACLPRGMFIPREVSKDKLVLSVVTETHATLAALQATDCVAKNYETGDAKVFKANPKIATFPICAKFSPNGRYLVQYFDPERMSRAAIRKMTPKDPANFDFAVACELGELPRGDTFRIALQAGQRLTLLAKAEVETPAPPAAPTAPPGQPSGDDKKPGVEPEAPPGTPAPAKSGRLQLMPEDHPGFALTIGEKRDPELRALFKNLVVHSAVSRELKADYSLVQRPMARAGPDPPRIKGPRA